LNIKLDSRFKKNLAGRFGKFDFQVGILQDGPHKEADEFKPKGSYAGGPVRKKTRQTSGKTISQVSADNRARLGFNFYSKPFAKKSSDIIKFTNEFFKLAFGKSETKRAINLLQAIVRNPILRQDYGSNSKITQKIKGFDRNMIDTAQLFKAIRATVNVRRR